jgi:hypothetical protein
MSDFISKSNSVIPIQDSQSSGVNICEDITRNNCHTMLSSPSYLTSDNYFPIGIPSPILGSPVLESQADIPPESAFSGAKDGW